MVNEKPVWAGVKSQGVSEIRMRGQLGSEVSTDVDLGGWAESQPGPPYEAELILWRPDSGASAVCESGSRKGYKIGDTRSALNRSPL